MRFTCARAAIIAAALLFALPSQSALAGDGWRIVDTAGDVKAGGAGFMTVALTNNQALPADAWVETKATGRAVLVRGLESIVVGPNSRVQLPKNEVNGNTQVLQTMGSALYQIGKQPKPHFQVDTPYLAAVVKGTKFTVTVDGDDASVAVSEGLVEVSTPDRSDVEFVPPGFTASVSRDRNGEVVIEKARGDGTPSGGAAVPGQTSSSTGASNSGPVVITEAIGEVELDVKEVSGGLAFGESKQVAGETASGASGHAKDKDQVDDASGVDPVDVASSADSTSSGDGSSNNGNSSNAGSGNGGGMSAPDLGGGGIDPGNGNGNGNNGNGNGNGGATEPDLGSGTVTVPDLDSSGNNGNGNSNAGGNGTGNGSGNSNAGGNDNGNANGHSK